MAVYDYMSAAGMLSAGDAGTIRNGYTAKGTFYAVFETGEADGNTYENRLVYDRVSEMDSVICLFMSSWLVAQIQGYWDFML